MKSILVISQSSSSQEIHQALFAKYRIDVASSFQECFQKYSQNRYEFAFLELTLLQENFSEYTLDNCRKALQPLRRVFPASQIIVISRQDQLRDAVFVLKAGASNYLTTPINADELKHVIESTNEAIRIRSELDYLRDQFWQRDSLQIIRTNNAVMKKVFQQIRSVAPTKTTVLLLGETGVGKGIIAKLLHHHSERQNNPFIHVHCGAMPDTLLESELFGHEKGAFTGAVKRKLGRFEIAKGGTIFLDEINTITPAAQIKLLQVLQDKIFQRVGGEHFIESDIRAIIASNQDLRKMSEAGEFRSDLYYRLSVFPIEIPPLRERPEDILILANTFLDKLNQLYFKEIYDFHPLVIEALQKYLWPGNIRELENLMERAYILETSSVLTPESFPQELFNSDLPKAKVLLDTSLSLAEMRQLNLEYIERQYLKELLARHQGKINHTAEAAGISTRQLHKLLTKYKIRKEEFKNVTFHI
ncbi:sigma-54-dependent Fis family transcriptional regulator [Deltaproteobacteria bacterium TL4]